MKNTQRPQNCVSKMHRAFTRTVLALTAILMLAAITTQSARAQTFTTLHKFDGTDGSNPYAGLVQATDGNLYGTTSEGGANSNSSCDTAGSGTNGCGTVFRITPGGTLTTLYNFCSLSGCTDGNGPIAALIQATNGSFYGTIFGGGANGDGTVFRLTLTGALTTLHSFCSLSGCADGGVPEAALVQASDGNLYGTTSGILGTIGTVFKITPSGTLTTLTSSFGPDGDQPTGALIQATNGTFYGTTYGGDPWGTVFKMIPSGALTELLNFDGTDGGGPYAGLVQGTDGNFYGTTSQGGSSTACTFGCGTVFKITSAGTLTTLHSFVGTDGESPFGALVQATDGNFYGTTQNGGANGDGTIFEITPTGTLTTLHSFDGADGDEPRAGLVQATNGIFYGTTEFGGNHNGTVFSLSVGLGPFVKTLPASGKVGAAVKILGTNLTGATSVTFNGTAATFIVVSKSEITTTVPTGATTGTVEVTIPSRTLKSNAKFRITP
jgi:uncharacterized repeat protein (TIGR03803 family)